MAYIFLLIAFVFLSNYLSASNDPSKAIRESQERMRIEAERAMQQRQQEFARQQAKAQKRHQGSLIKSMQEARSQNQKK